MIVTEQMLKSVFFIAPASSDACHSSPRATGFFLSLKDSTSDARRIYAVTAAHVINRVGPHRDIIIQVNSKDGPIREIRTDHKQWITLEDRTKDVAALPFDFEPWMDICAMMFESFGDHLTVHPGDDVFMIGLFTRHSGTTRIAPIVRVGNVAAVPRDPMPVPGGEAPAYLIECRSVGGLSGSPVFLRRGPELRTADGIKWDFTKIEYRLIGLIHGHWDLGIPTNGNSAHNDEVEKVNTGIAVVVPLVIINDVLFSETLEHERSRFFHLHASEPPLPRAE
jgi:hypothetical protein